MKANEAPEKIYLSYETDEDGYIYTNYMWHMHQFEGVENIEYTRTDAFIEKATSYIQQHFIWNTKMIEDFKKYMEGE